MNIPEQIQILGREWTIELKPQVVSDGYEVLGLCRTNNTIEVATHPTGYKKQTRTQIMETLLHEISHAIFREMGFYHMSFWNPDIEELAVDQISRVFNELFHIRFK